LYRWRLNANGIFLFCYILGLTMVSWSKNRLVQSVIISFGLILRFTTTHAADSPTFLILPYVQNPTQNAITVRWATAENVPSSVTVRGGTDSLELNSEPNQPQTLAYNVFSDESSKRVPRIPWFHSVRISDLQPGTDYQFQVKHNLTGSTETSEHKFFQGRFRTAPHTDQPVRFMIYSDSETEPESSTSPPVDWPAADPSKRPDGLSRYFVNQTVGYQQNLKIIDERNPDFICIVGDLVESGGEQRDWDEFWEHVAGEYGTAACRRPIFPAIGNHENFGGPGAFGGYSAEAANFGVHKYLTYFDVPSNNATDPRHHGRYYRVDYGPITLITLDSSDGLPHQTASDTNHSLSGSEAPDFKPGSEQFAWLEKQLADAQTNNRFTFVQFHHTPYGSGPHSVPFGVDGFSGQSGIAMRILTPVFLRYGVDAVFCGHDEMQERSLVPGVEKRPDGTEREHQIHYFDVGMGGDGLRGPSKNADNPFRKYLAHTDNPEVWDGKRLVSGGKHYGHLEVNVAPDEKGLWKVTIEPVHAFPLMDTEGNVTGWERRVCNDVVEIPQQ
jgi:hypothetical protein